MVDYKKWDALARELDREDNEEAARENMPLMAATRPSAADEADGRLVDKIAQRHGLSPLLARFIVVQAQGEGKDDNVDRYQQILKLLAEHPELMQQQETCDKLVDAALRAVNEGVEGYAEVASAANTLLAMRKHGAIELFAEIATPTTDQAKALRLRYARREFAKEAFLQKMLGDDEYARLRGVVQQAHDDISYCPSWCPCPKAFNVGNCVIC